MNFDSLREEKLFDDMVRAFSDYMTVGRDHSWNDANELANELKDVIDKGLVSKFIALTWLLKTQDTHMAAWVLNYLVG